ncbi:putative BSD domain-containing protein [Helianthus annuus]|uniref:BSD domain-containing protein n=1 Tax=Helianthus annuus TaxID=4232 RepID=A0A9K3ILR2_HELAN|nr:putative BSD domain-containing protein [Helianthus annuus]KAJ0550352.1 putative BSD domain-containing protein [Helianthus annuus]KAJ0557052.1 putative BSD domain-containing protein [Helianthus annuus]KAJ0563308.1 putative BSD domain-containing protein [Helianthus annuus]KAJ0728655.1 putative BSD domain-containing protein [Helianthus annuus]
MSESSFWKIYFVLLHPRLERDAADLLSTPNIVKARALLTLEVSAMETVKHPVKSDDVQIVDKSVIQVETHEVKDEDDWLKEESPETVAILIKYNGDVSFSDLEDDDDDDGNIPIHYKNATYASDCSTKDLRDSVQLNRSSIDRKGSDSSAQVSVHDSQMKGANDWLDVDIDVA